MFDQLMALVRESGQQAVVENPEVPNEHNEAVMEEATTSIQSGVQNLMQTGGPTAVQSLFDGVQSGDTNRPEVQQVTDHFSGNLMQKFGLGSGAAKSIAISLIPMVLGKLMNRNGGQGGGFNIGSILGGIMGGSNSASMIPGVGTSVGAKQGSGGMLSDIGTKMGLDRDGDGDTDMSDLMGMFKK
jgi:hypothetical protein